MNLSPHFSHSGWQQILGGPFKPLFGLSGVAALSPSQRQTSMSARNLHFVISTVAERSAVPSTPNTHFR
jgi:hypothetical protein